MIKNSFKYASPIIMTYLFLSFVFGFMVYQKHLSMLIALSSSLFLYTGAFQFVLISMIQTSSLLSILTTCFMMNSRMFFYGFTFSKDFYQGPTKLYQIHTLTDETYALNLTLINKQNKKQLILLCAFLAHISWIIGTLLGYYLGSLLKINLNGIDFCMTAMFITIFIDGLEKKENHFSSILGVIIGLICLFLFHNNFMIVALIIGSLILYCKEKKPWKL